MKFTPITRLTLHVGISSTTYNGAAAPISNVKFGLVPAYQSPAAGTVWVTKTVTDPEQDGNGTAQVDVAGASATSTSGALVLHPGGSDLYMLLEEGTEALPVFVLRLTF